MTNPLQARIDRRDSLHLTPTERAELLNEFVFAMMGFESAEDAIQQPYVWDMACYCSQVLAYFALASEDDDLLGLAKAMSNRIHSIHYSVPDSHPTLGPGRDEHEQFWRDLIESVI